VESGLRWVDFAQGDGVEWMAMIKPTQYGAAESKAAMSRRNRCADIYPAR